MKKYILGIGVVIFFLFVIQLNCFAQNEEAVGNEDMSMIGLGTVAGVEANQLVVTEYEYETDNEQEVSYSINDKTMFDNLKSLNDLKSGDSVEVIYTEAAGKKVALSVSKEDDYIEDEGTDASAVPASAVETTVPASLPQPVNEIKGEAANIVAAR